MPVALIIKYSDWYMTKDPPISKTANFERSNVPVESRDDDSMKIFFKEETKRRRSYYSKKSIIRQLKNNNLDKSKILVQIVLNGL